jgi:hypothetical protein
VSQRTEAILGGMAAAREFVGVLARAIGWTRAFEDEVRLAALQCSRLRNSRAINSLSETTYSWMIC